MTQPRSAASEANLSPEIEAVITDIRATINKGLQFGWSAAESLSPAVNANLALQQQRDEFTTLEFTATLTALICQDSVVALFEGAVGEPATQGEMIEKTLHMITLAVKSYIPACREIYLNQQQAEAAAATANGGAN